MLYRFADEDSLAAGRTPRSGAGGWARPRAWSGSRGCERRTGIEGWFDEPAHTDVEDLRPVPPAPPRWKQMVVIWLAFFPLSLLSSWVLRRAPSRTGRCCRGC